MGLNRATDAASLVALHKSIAQKDIQALYCTYVLAMDSILKPDHLGLAVETNAIRDNAPDSVYQGIKTAASQVVAELRKRNSSVPLSISVQVEWAWGLFSGGTFKGIDQDMLDFPFIQEVGLSSYPYFAFSTPEKIPANYYSRLVANSSLPVFVSEGGWSSKTVGSYPESTQLQADYITFQDELLNNANAIALFQLTFTDINVSALSSSIPSSLDQFAYIGLVDSNFQPKPALTSWKNNFAKTKRN